MRPNDSKIVLNVRHSEIEGDGNIDVSFIVWFLLTIVSNDNNFLTNCEL